MTEQRFYFAPRQKIAPGSLISLSGSEAAHLARVLRKRTGDRIRLFDGKGLECSGQIISLRSGEIIVRIESISGPPPSPRPRIGLGQALPKGAKMDQIIREATELGVSAIFPFTSSRTVPRLTGDRAREKTGRWRRIGIAASKQSGRKEIPEIHPPREFAEVLGIPGFDLRLILSEQPGETTLYQCLHSRPAGPACSVLVLVGPEGGFAREEFHLARENDFLAVSLGSEILRTETVAPVILGILRYELEGNAV